jgi:beta-glucosidase
VKITVENQGVYDAIEIVQIYVAVLDPSVTWAEMELKAFRRVPIAQGAEVNVVFALPASDCSIVNAAAARVVEPGRFEFRVGKSSAKIAFSLPFRIA